MLSHIKLAALRVLKGAGIFELIADSRWRQQRLLILCYHGTSLADEHLWRPGLYMDPTTLEQRLEILKRGRYPVLPLAEALHRLKHGTLPSRSVVITFDDGTYDFYKQAFPRLKSYGFPVTVYQTTYYTDFERPVFNLIASYMLWKTRGTVIQDGSEVGLTEPLDLRTEAGRHKVVRSLMDRAERQNLSGKRKDELALCLGRFLGVDYEAMVAMRMFQLMNARELQEVVRDGVDIQLHTHRHRTPENEESFRREISDNRQRLGALVASAPQHFCYPSGVYKPQFLRWLRQEQVVSASTCDAGLVTRRTEPLLMPRFIDNENRTALAFESWLSGVGDLLAFRRAASQKYIPHETDN
jgi:peptidoglycan/xylan/chitin deacetylase (PgdA/CDA1 family)